MSDDGRPRSRFDRAPESAPRSRFDRDRRSRSPVNRDSEPRTRSPIARESTDSPSTVGSQSKPNAADAAAAAKAAAARIAASIAAKKGVQSVDVPPIRAPSIASPSPLKSPSNKPGEAIVSEAYQQDGDHIQDIEINDLRNRYTLTKGAFQKKIKDETGADVTTRGEYYPDKTMATAASPPLYLRITSTSKEGLDAAVDLINETMKQDLPNLVDERRFRRREPENIERDEFGRRKWPEEKLPVDLEPINGFNLRAQVVGRGGDNVKYIQNETQCKVQIKGRGSGFIEPVSNQESDEPMYLHIAGPRPEGVAYAKQLCEELLKKVKEDYYAYKERPPQPRFNRDEGYGHGGGRPGYGDRQRSDSNSYGDPYGGHHGGHNGAANETAAASAAGANFDWSQYQQYAAYYAQHPEQDPYAAQGGFASVMSAWYSYYNTGATQSPAQGFAAAPPPPPPSEPAPPGTAPPPPPPPPSGSPPGGYSAVPPPPGL